MAVTDQKPENHKPLATQEPSIHGPSPMARASLQKRGSLLIWLDKEMTWFAPHDGRPGRPAVFSDAAIQFCLTIKVLFKLPLTGC